MYQSLKHLSSVNGADVRPRCPGALGFALGTFCGLLFRSAFGQLDNKLNYSSFFDGRPLSPDINVDGALLGRTSIFWSLALWVCWALLLGLAPPSPRI